MDWDLLNRQLALAVDLPNLRSIDISANPARKASNSQVPMFRKPVITRNQTQLMQNYRILQCQPQLYQHLPTSTHASGNVFQSSPRSISSNEAMNMSRSSSSSSSPLQSSLPNCSRVQYSKRSSNSRVSVDYNLLEKEDVNPCQDSIVTELDRWISVLCDSTNPSVTMERNTVTRFLRRLKGWHQRQLEMNLELCVFCRNNNEPYEMYISHKVKDNLGNVVCPVLRRYTCPLCGLTGDNAHTIKHCSKYKSSKLADNKYPLYAN